MLDVYIPEEDLLVDYNDNDLKKYLEEINRFPLLSAAQERDWGRLMSKPCRADRLLKNRLTPWRETILVHWMSCELCLKEAEETKERFTNANLKLVVHIAMRYVGRGVELLDLIQEGNFGLMRAVDGFDWRKGCRFSTYAILAIRRALVRTIAEKGAILRLPARLHGRMLRYFRAQNELLGCLGRDPSKEELAQKLGLCLEDIKEIESVIIHKDPRSLDETLKLDSGNGTEGSLLGDTIAEQVDLEFNQSSTEKGMLSRTLAEELDSAMAEVLNLREQKIIGMRFGRDPYPHDFTLEEIAGVFGLTRARILQIESAILRKLRKSRRVAELNNKED